MRVLGVATILAAVSMAGCSTAARSPSFQGSEISPAPRLPAAEVQADKHVLMIDGGLPEGLRVKTLGEVRVNAGRVSSAERMYKELALRGRYVGADAVVNINYKIRIAPFVAGAPSISGVAVQFDPLSSTELAELEGRVIRSAEEWIISALKDADSAKIRAAYFSNAKIPIICGEVNAKNSMGGYTGFKRFYFGGTNEFSGIEGDLADDAFAMRYLNLCTGKRQDVALSVPKSAPTNSVADEIHKLHLLLERGVITKEEFEGQKARLLN